MVIAAGARFNLAAIAGSSIKLVRSRCRLGFFICATAARNLEYSISTSYLLCGRGDHGFEGELFLAVVEFHSTADLHHVIAVEGAYDWREVFPHLRGDGSGAVGKLQLKPRGTGTGRSA